MSFSGDVMETNGGAKSEKFVLKLVVDNRKGVMARIATLLARKGYNISSIIVGKHMVEGEANITLTIHGSNDEVEQAKQMLGKLINVISIEAFHEKDIAEREHCLIKIKGGAKGSEAALLESAKGINGRVVHKGEGFIVFEVADSPSKVEEFVKRVLKEFEIIDISRSGANAI